MNKKIILFTILLASFSQAHLQTINENLVASFPKTKNYYTTRPGNLFLLIPPDSRTAGMGNAGIASMPDVTAIFYNPAKLTFVNEDIGLHASYTPWFTAVGAQGMFIFSGGGYYKNKYNAFSLSTRFFQYSQATDVVLSSNAVYERLSIKPYEFEIDLSYARRLAKGLSLGITGKTFSSNIQNVSTQGYKAATGFLSDISLFYEQNVNYREYNRLGLYSGKDYYNFGYDKLYAGVTLSNAGARLFYSDTSNLNGELSPTSLNFGVGYMKIINELNKFVLTAEVNKLLVPSVIDSATKADLYKQNVLAAWGQSFGPESIINTITFNIGGEYWYNNLFALRAGYSRRFETKAITGLTAGMSLRFYIGSIDLAYFVPLNEQTSNFHPLSNTLRFGMSFYFK